jgi:hypothetical protein
VKSILDKSFVYTPSHRTNIAETFRRLRDAARQQGSAPLTERTGGREATGGVVAAAPIQIRRKHG